MGSGWSRSGWSRSGWSGLWEGQLMAICRLHLLEDRSKRLMLCMLLVLWRREVGHRLLLLLVLVLVLLVVMDQLLSCI